MSRKNKGVLKVSSKDNEIQPMDSNTNHNENESPDLSNEVESILGCAKHENELKFIIKFKNDSRVRMIPAKIANLKYPMPIIKFYEERISWKD